MVRAQFRLRLPQRPEVGVPLRQQRAVLPERDHEQRRESGREPAPAQVHAHRWKAAVERCYHAERHEQQ